MSKIRERSILIYSLFIVFSIIIFSSNLIKEKKLELTIVGNFPGDGVIEFYFVHNSEIHKSFKRVTRFHSSKHELESSEQSYKIPVDYYLIKNTLNNLRIDFEGFSKLDHFILKDIYFSYQGKKFDYLNLKNSSIVSLNDLKKIKDKIIHSEFEVIGDDPYLYVIPPQIPPKIHHLIKYYNRMVVGLKTAMLILSFLFLLLIVQKGIENIFFKNRIIFQIKNKFNKDVMNSFFLSIFVFTFLYPFFLKGRKFHLSGFSFELWDPTVSFLNFFPGISVLYYEWQNHFNYLWSSLRSMGMPLLVNEIQAAPLFPLTLLFSFFSPETYFTLLVVCRSILTFMAAFLIAKRLFKFHFWSSALFSLLLVYSFFVMRWINHPWSNGLMAGMWYIYFMISLILSYESFSIKKSLYREFLQGRIGKIIGLSISVYSLVTCGFPEASMMMGLIGVIFFIVYFFDGMRICSDRSCFLKSCFFSLFLSHLIGLLLSSFQLFSLFEALHLMPHGFRNGIGNKQIPLDQFWDHLFGGIAYNHSEERSPEPRNNFFGLIPSYLFFSSLFLVPFYIRKYYRSFLIAIISFLFYIFKAFPLNETFNNLISKIPVLNESWFIVYYYPIFLTFFAILSALSFETFFHLIEEGKYRKKGFRFYFTCYSLISLALMIYFINTYTPILQKISYLKILYLPGVSELYWREILLFVLFLILLLFLIFQKMILSHKRDYSLYAFLLFLLILINYDLILPKSFFFKDSDDFKRFYSPLPDSPSIFKGMEKLGLKDRPFELREFSCRAKYVKLGIASIDNGAPAILWPRLRLFRNTVFQTDWEGYLPIGGIKQPYSFELAGVNLFQSSNENFYKEFHKDADPKILPLERYKSLSDSVTLYFDQNSLPRAFIPKRCFASPSPDYSAERIKDIKEFKLGDLYVEEMSDSDQRFCHNFKREKVTPISIKWDHGSEIALETIKGPAIIELNDTYYPGWEAKDEISQKKFQIYPTNINFKSIFLEEEREYSVTFIYKPSWYYVAWIFVILGIVLLLLLILV